MNVTDSNVGPINLQVFKSTFKGLPSPSAVDGMLTRWTCEIYCWKIPCDVSNYTIAVLFQIDFYCRMVTCVPSVSSTCFVHKDALTKISWHKSWLKKATDTHPWFRYFRCHLWEIFVRKCFCSVRLLRAPCSDVSYCCPLLRFTVL